MSYDNGITDELGLLDDKYNYIRIFFPVYI